MNLLSALPPPSVPLEPIEGIQGRVRFTGAARAVRVSNEMARETVRLLDPNVGRRLNAKA